MSKLYMRQRLPSGQRRFSVRDQAEQDRYFVEAELLSVGQWLYIYDLQGRELMLIQKKPPSSPRTEILAGGRVIATVRRRPFSSRSYEITGPDWRAAKGAPPVVHEITGERGPVATVRRTSRSWGEAYELEVADGVSEVAALAVAMAIDFALEEEVSSPAVIASSYV